MIPVRLLLRDRGDRTFAAVLAKLRCQKCRKPPAPVYLCAGHREFTMGAPADWSIELVPVPSSRWHKPDFQHFRRVGRLTI